MAPYCQFSEAELVRLQTPGRCKMWIDSVMFERQADRMPNEPERWLLNDDCVYLCFTFLLSLTPIPTLCSADCRSVIICARFSHLTLL